MFVFITFAPGGCAPFALPDKAKPMPTTYSGQLCQVLAFLSIKKLTKWQFFSKNNRMYARVARSLEFSV